MAGCIRRLPVRRMLLAAAVAVVVCLVWRGGPVTVGAVLGWGLGVVPVHVTLRGQTRGPAWGGVRGPVRGPDRGTDGGSGPGPGRRRIRRPAEEYEQGRQGDGRAGEPGEPGGRGPVAGSGAG
jgi:hypothetical protein